MSASSIPSSDSEKRPLSRWPWVRGAAGTFIPVRVLQMKQLIWQSYKSKVVTKKIEVQTLFEL
jgi:hypothetical protein